MHVAGTKGKGSTVEYIAAAMRSAGRVGIFTSPHIHTARERIKVNTSLISRSDFVRLAKEALERAESTPNNDWIVFFDHLLVMALHYFSEQQVESIVLETGIGGRCDIPIAVLDNIIPVLLLQV